MTHTPHLRPLLASLALLLIAAATGCTDDHIGADPNLPADTGLPVDFSSISIASSSANGTGGSTSNVPTTNVGGFYNYDVIHARLTHDGKTQEARLTYLQDDNAMFFWQASNPIYWQSTDPATGQTLTLSRGPEGDFTLPDDMDDMTRLWTPDGRLINVLNYALHDRLFLSYRGPMPAAPTTWTLDHCMAQIVVTLTRADGSTLPTDKDLRKARVSMTLPAEGHFNGVSGEVSRRNTGAGGGAVGAKQVKFHKGIAQGEVYPYFAVALPGSTGTRIITITIPANVSSTGAEQMYQYTAPADITLEAGHSRVFCLSLGTRVSALSITTTEWQEAAQGPGVSEGIGIKGVTPGSLKDLLPKTADNYGHISVSGELNYLDYQALRTFLDGLPSPVSLEIDITGGDRRIPSDAFSYCDKLGAVVLKGIEEIWEAAFTRSSLTSITLHEGLWSISTNAFAGCKGLKSITLPSSVTFLGEHAFYGCTNLASVSLPEGLETIEAFAFSACTSLKSITLPAKVTTWGNAIFSSSGLTSIVLPEGMAEIPANTFQDCGSLQTITLPSTITTVGEYAFYGSGLTSIILPKGVTKIGIEAFMNCAKLQKVAVADVISISVGKDAFEGTPNNKELYDYVNQDIAVQFPYTWQTMHCGYNGSGDKLDPNSYNIHYTH